MPRPTLLIGVGNRDRGDDAVGPIVCDLVAERTEGAIPTVVMETSVLDLPEHWCAADRVVLVDAGRPSGRPGLISEFDGLDHRLVDPGTVSTHSIDVAAAIELARVLGRLPVALAVISVEGESFDVGATLSAPVRRSAEQLAEELGRLGASRLGGA